MQERRKDSRRKMPLDIPLYEQDNDHILGFLADISPHGLRISSDEPLSQGTELGLKMQLPESWSDLQELDFTAQCCWWEDEESNGAYSSGFQIIDIHQEAADVLQSLLEEYGIPMR